MTPSSVGEVLVAVIAWWFKQDVHRLATVAVWGGVLVVTALLLYLWALQGLRMAGLVVMAGLALAWLRRRSRGRGGLREHSSEYEATMQSAGWRRRRRRAIRRAGRRCQRCGARGSLDVHHLTYARLGRERPGDLLAVCASCHGALHGPAGGSRRRKEGDADQWTTP